MGDKDIISVESIGKILGGFITSGGVTSVADAVSAGLQLILRLTEDDPVKRQKILREYEDEMTKIIRSVPNVEEKDVTEIVSVFIALMRAK